MDNLVVCAADIGSIQQGHFGWCRATYGQPTSSGTDINDFAGSIAADLTANSQVALGFECPLFVPITADPIGLTRARRGEGRRPWSAGASALATGLTECVWVFEQLRTLTTGIIRPTLDWNTFLTANANLFIWEAFVSEDAKVGTHHDDAETAVKAFWSAYPHIDTATTIYADNPYSLVGAALLRAGLTQDISILSQACTVIKG